MSRQGLLLDGRRRASGQRWSDLTTTLSDLDYFMVAMSQYDVSVATASKEGIEAATSLERQGHVLEE